MTPVQPATSGGVLSRATEEIAELLAALQALDTPLVALSVAGEAGLPFVSRILLIDPRRHYLFVAAHGDSVANAALAARPRITFMADLADRHIEFVATDPQPARLGGRAAIRLRFPEVFASHPKRSAARTAAPPLPSLHCTADEQGPASFDGRIVDVGAGGIGFLVYSPDITLEPGTLLRGCRIERPGGKAVYVDLEVRYSRPILLADGRRATRSGCRFVELSAEVNELIRAFTGDKQS